MWAQCVSVRLVDKVQISFAPIGRTSRERFGYGLGASVSGMGSVRVFWGWARCERWGGGLSAKRRWWAFDGNRRKSPERTGVDFQDFVFLGNAGLVRTKVCSWPSIHGNFRCCSRFAAILRNRRPDRCRHNCRPALFR